VLGLVGLVLSIAVVDSLNPTTIVPALFYATGPRPARTVLGFTLGFLAVNMAGGVALVLGPGQVVLAAIPRPGGNARHLLELVLGLAAVAGAIVVLLLRNRVRESFARSEHRIERASPVTGATIAAVELPTALPYFVVIAAVVGADVNVASQVALIALFNLVYVAPLLIIAAISRVSGDRAAVRMQWIRTHLMRYSGALSAVLLLGVGIALVVAGIVGFA
jgi:cytochrome c biogenesis protein CcdA